MIQGADDANVPTQQFADTLNTLRERHAEAVIEMSKQGIVFDELTGNWHKVGNAASAAARLIAEAAMGEEEAAQAAQELNSALLTVSESGIGSLRTELRGLNRQWKDLTDGPDQNKKSLKELDAAINKWQRNYANALADGRGDQMAFAAVVLGRLEAERKQRKRVRDEVKQNQEAVQTLSGLVGGMPERKVTRLVLQGGQSAIDTLALVSGMIGAIDTTVTVAVNTVFGAFGGRRASGGPVQRGRTYLVGERGPELLTMGRSGGHVTPNHRLGGGGGDVYLDGEKVGRIIDQRFGNRFAAVGSGGAYRSAV
jgi:hypothetical protein